MSSSPHRAILADRDRVTYSLGLQLMTNSYSYYKRSLITINLINCTIYLPKGREFKKNENIIPIQYTIEIKKRMRVS